jgi:hypothetical protein
MKQSNNCPARFDGAGLFFMAVMAGFLAGKVEKCAIIDGFSKPFGG